MPALTEFGRGARTRPMRSCPLEPALKFAVVREDSRLEAHLVDAHGPAAVLLVGSGGCTALNLAAQYPALPLTVFDINAAQLAHLARKARAAARGDLAALNVEVDDAEALNQCGAFEGLFQLVRHHIELFITGAQGLETLFDPGCPAAQRAASWARLRASPYWRAAFCGAFNDVLLHAMFGPDATQHAPRGSYPGYFEAAFRRGLAANGAHHNPFLQHVLLGRYRLDDAPPYVRSSGAFAADIVHGPLDCVADMERFGLVSLSNLFDWADDGFAVRSAKVLAGTRPGTHVLIRQLNNVRPIERFFAPHFTFDADAGARLGAMDRSLFYNRILVGRRTEFR